MEASVNIQLNCKSEGGIGMPIKWLIPVLLCIATAALTALKWLNNQKKKAEEAEEQEQRCLQEEAKRRSQLKKAINQHNKDMVELADQRCFQKSFERLGKLFCFSAQYLSTPDDSSLINVLQYEIEDLQYELKSLFNVKLPDKEKYDCIQIKENASTAELESLVNNIVAPIIIPYRDVLSECKDIISNMRSVDTVQCQRLCEILKKHKFVFVTRAESLNDRRRLDFSQSAYGFSYPALYYCYKGKYILIENGGCKQNGE